MDYRGNERRGEGNKRKKGVGGEANGGQTKDEEKRRRNKRKEYSTSIFRLSVPCLYQPVIAWL